MPKLTPVEVRALASVYGFNPFEDWHAMSTASKEAVLKAADSRGYRKGPAANGSRGRMFADYCRRVMEGRARLFINWRGGEGLETIDSLDSLDFESVAAMRREANRLATEYALSGMPGAFVSTREAR